MRMRKKKNSEKRIQACEDFLQWMGIFAEDKPIHLEIGCGKGDFICAMAKKYPDVNFIAVEKISDIVVMALEKAKSENLPNVKFLVSDANKLAELFKPQTIAQIYLNFSDPWPKRYQHHNRLTSEKFIEVYKKILAPKSSIRLKTDNRDFFDFSAKNLSAGGFYVNIKTYDLYSSEFFDSDENIQTEYEKNFAAKNIPICFLEAIFSSV